MRITFECINTIQNIVILIDEVNNPKFNEWKNLEDDEIISLVPERINSLDAENASRGAVDLIPLILKGCCPFQGS